LPIGSFGPLTIFTVDHPSAVPVVTMTEEFFYHYTDAQSAQEIFLSGTIEPSAISRGNAVHGTGVYLTTLDTSHGREVIANNNWGGVVTGQRDQVERTECYFEILLPSNEGRDIQIYNGELVLENYKWNLRSWDGELLATQYFMVRSEGGAAQKYSYLMGRYTICENIVTHDDNPVYKKEGEHVDVFLYTDYNGDWRVGTVVGTTRCNLQQSSDFSPSPNRTKMWQYAANGRFIDDPTLKVYACY